MTSIVQQVCLVDFTIGRLVGAPQAHVSNQNPLEIETLCIRCIVSFIVMCTHLVKCPNVSP